MSLLVFMYHRARLGRHGNPADMLDPHFAHIAACHRNVLPGEPLEPSALNVCLTFDDGYYDFYARVFPLLQKHGLRAVLAVPAFVVRQRVETPCDERMKIASDAAFEHPSHGGFCTWPELEEMTASGSVTVAAHGFTHTRLDAPDANLDTEVHAPKTLLGSRLAQPVESFMFPFGRYSPRSLTEARQSYRYVFRIGGACNRGWDSPLLYRIDADEMETPWALFAPWRLAQYRARYLWNRLRRR